MTLSLRAGALALLMAVAGCAMAPVDARALTPNVPQPQDTRRIEIPLYVILDPAKLPDAMTAQGPGVKPIEVSGLHAFVERDLQKALSQLFSRVVVAPPSTAAPAETFFTGMVLINSLTTFTQAVAPGSSDKAVFMRMQWSLHIRAYGAPADAFVYQGTAQSTVPITSVRETSPAFNSVLEDALARLLAHFDGQKAYDRLSRTGR
ncbi:MAG: hypothetical protein JNL82_35755 [Myxococcales bacterium]|jgi:hypothetical protein|nr:hypothetical protein [Myxococcales bacterium]